MKIIYHCYGGAHSSVTAAAIHLGQLPDNLLPRAKKFYRFDFYDWQNRKTHGNIYFMGTDKDNNEVYVLGRRNIDRIIYNLTHDLLKSLNIEPNSLMLVDASKNINIIMRAGGILSRRLGLVKIGRPIVIWGTLIAYPYLIKLVQEVKIKVASQT